MSNLLTDIFITFKNRDELFEQSLKSLYENTPREFYRLTVICDDGYAPKFLNDYDPDYVIINGKNMGLGPCINHALAHIDTVNKWNASSPLLEDYTQNPDFICYCQDDLLYSKGWLEKLMQMFSVFENSENIGFASGVECIEHSNDKVLINNSNNIVIKKPWIRAANMFARKEYWMSMFPISAFDPETGRKRAKPNDGMGSGVDWWFIRNHKNSIVKTGKSCIVIPGLLKHLGYSRSTWLNRELPESESDKEEINQVLSTI